MRHTDDIVLQSSLSLNVRNSDGTAKDVGDIKKVRPEWSEIVENPRHRFLGALSSPS
jgi:hypothetical protein